MSDNILLISVDILKERTGVHGNLDPSLVYPDIKVAQDMYIEPILGTALFVKLQTLVSDGTISDPPNSDYKNLLDKHVIDTLIYYTLSLLPVDISYQFWNKGVVRKQGQDTDTPSMSELVDISRKHNNTAEFYANRMKKYLLDQSSRLQKYPEYLNPGSTIDTVTPNHKQFTMPIYLGDVDPDPWCNEMGFNGQPYKP
jgi:hypothetical protein